MYMCPVCYYGQMQYPAADYNICPCCGTEFENDDDDRTHAELREAWVENGAKWFFRQPPATWNPWQQLAEAGFKLPYPTIVTYAPTHVWGTENQTYSYASSGTIRGYALYKGLTIGSLADTLLTTNLDTQTGEKNPTILVGEITEEPFGMAA